MNVWTVRILTVSLFTSVLLNILSLPIKKATAEDQALPAVNEAQFKVQYNYKVVFAESDRLQQQISAISETGWEFHSVAARGQDGWLLIFRQFERIRETI
jgi:hypothetical protein